MNKFISLSFGVESTTMCILFGSDAKAIWCDTGSEHKKMYERVTLVEEQIKLIHPNFEIIKIKPSVKCLGKIVRTVEEYAIESKFMPSPQRRWCTNRFKIIPIDEYLSQFNECELMICLNADEVSREGNYEMMANVNYTYPLQDLGLTRLDCEIILHEHNLHPKFPAYMSRGGCRMCPYKTEKEYRALYYLDRNEYLEVMAFEEAIQDRRKKFYSIMGNGKSLRQLMHECDTSIGDYLFNKSAYENIKPQEKSCGYFCHR